MRCTRPRTVGFYSDGKTICWSSRKYSKEFATFQLPCGKCLQCRLDYARQWSVRCVHEAQMYEKNCFITLTYSDENLLSDKLYYVDFQKFAKRLRKKLGKQKIGYFVTGEYGDKTKRPHWHACIFNWSPGDGVYKYTSDRGDKVYESKVLTDLWGNGIAEYGSLTFESAGYCARYAAKKLVHGNDGTHEYEPVSKKSSRQAIGKAWLEKNWRDVFNYGECFILDSQGTPRNVGSVPRYYEKWLAKTHPDEWIRYVTQIKSKKIQSASARSEKEKSERKWIVGVGPEVDGIQAREVIGESKFKNMLQKYLKL